VKDIITKSKRKLSDHYERLDYDKKQINRGKVIVSGQGIRDKL
jgi:hypothetical protein